MSLGERGRSGGRYRGAVINSRTVPGAIRLTNDPGWQLQSPTAQFHRDG
jgi:hypothetical protein